jgi:hypothetical protein
MMNDAVEGFAKRINKWSLSLMIDESRGNLFVWKVLVWPSIEACPDKAPLSDAHWNICSALTLSCSFGWLML